MSTTLGVLTALTANQRKWLRRDSVACEPAAASAWAEFLRWRPVARQFGQPPHVVRTVEGPLLGQGLVYGLGDRTHDQVHHVVPVVAEPGQPLDRLPRLRRVVGQQLVRDYLVNRDVQRGVHRLAVGTRYLLVVLECLLHLQVLRLEQERALVLVVR